MEQQPRQRQSATASSLPHAPSPRHAPAAPMPPSVPVPVPGSWPYRPCRAGAGEIGSSSGSSSSRAATGNGDGGDVEDDVQDDDSSPRGRRRRSSIAFDPLVRFSDGAKWLVSATADDQQPQSSRGRRQRLTAAHRLLISPPLGPAANSTATPGDDAATGLSPSPSDSVATSPFSEIQTPPAFGDGECYFRMVRSSSGSSGGSGGWSKAVAVDAAGESKPLPLDREGDVPVPRSRSRSRSGPFRGRAGSSALDSSCSPASMFLRSFAAVPTPSHNNHHAHRQPVEPDSEGQEVGPYVLGREVGRGGFSCVREAFALEDGAEVARAVKIVRKNVYDTEPENDQVQADFEREVALWRLLHHPHVLPLVAVLDTPFATFAVMPLLRHGSLCDLLRRREHRRRGLPAARARRYAGQLAGALRYLHEDMRIAHGDVKPENCLLDLSCDAELGGNIVLCDFGLARFCDDQSQDRPRDQDQDQDQDQSLTYCITGSLPYSSPEMLLRAGRDEPCAPPADVWAFAVTVYALHTGVLPFNNGLPQKLAAMIMDGRWDADQLAQSWGLREAGAEAAQSVVDVVEGGLRADVDERWTIGDVLDSPWLAAAGESLCC